MVEPEASPLVGGVGSLKPEPRALSPREKKRFGTVKRTLGRAELSKRPVLGNRMKKPALTIAECFRSLNCFHSRPGICPHCGIAAAFQNVGQQNIAYGKTFPFEGADQCTSLQAHTAMCLACNGIVFGMVKLEGSKPPKGYYLWPLEAWPDRAPEQIEPEIKHAYDEARAVLPLSPMAAAVLARRCLQHVLRERLNIEKSVLFDQIERAVVSEELSKPTRDALHHIRQIGNWAAHPSVDQSNTLIEVTRQEAEYTLEAVEMVFYDVYVATARAVAMGARIEQKKVGTPEKVQ